MPRAILVGESQPHSALVESEFNAWYDGVHVPQILEQFPGVLSATRYRLAQDQPGPTEDSQRRRYLTIYEVDTDDVMDLVTDLVAALRDGRLDRSDAVDLADSSPVLHVYHLA